jgi:hypothetical protein
VLLLLEVLWEVLRLWTKEGRTVQSILLRLSHRVACAVPLPLLLPLFVTGAAAAGPVGEAGPY